MLSPTGLPPSAAPMVMPGTVRSASVSDVAPVCAMTSAGTIVTDFGVSSSGAVNLVLAEVGCWLAPVTWTLGIVGSGVTSGPAWATAGSASDASMASAGVGNVRACLRLVMKEFRVLFLLVVMVWGIALCRASRCAVISRNMNENDSHYDSD